MARKPIYKSASKKRAPNRGAFKKITITEQEKEFVKEEFAAISSENIDRLSDGAKQYYYSLKGAKNAKKVYINPLTKKRIKSIVQQIDAANPDLPPVWNPNVSIEKLVKNNPSLLKELQKDVITVTWIDADHILDGNFDLKFNFPTRKNPKKLIEKLVDFCKNYLYAIRIYVLCEVYFLSKKTVILLTESQIEELLLDIDNPENEGNEFEFDEVLNIKKDFDLTGALNVIVSNPANKDKEKYKAPAKKRARKSKAKTDANLTILDL